MTGPRLSFLATALLVGILPAGASQKVFVTVPPVEWDALVPYIRSNLLFGPGADRTEVRVCSHPTMPPEIQRYRSDLDELAKVLIWESIVRRKNVIEAVREVGRGIDQGNTAEVMGCECASVACDSQCWEQLLAHPHFIPELKAVFLKATAKGRIRCRLCENGFAPEALDVLE